MEISITVNECSECRHSDHTGSFTINGTKPCCGHPITVKERGDNCFRRIIPYKKEYYELFKRELAVAKGIPNWCPLKRGYKY